MTCSCLPFPPWRPRLALAVALGLLVPACSDASDDVLTLIDEPIPIDDIQTDVAVGSGVDLTYATFDGGEANFVAYAGTPLVINFFARTCPPCVSEMPEFERVFNELRGEVAFVGISTDPRQQDAQTLVEETGVTYDLGWDPDGRLFAEFGGFAMPTTVFVTADGIVSEVWSGVLSADELQSKIEEIT